MDMYIELSYYRFEAFKMLAKNYLRLDDHWSFSDKQRLIKEVEITLADIVELLMLWSCHGDAAEANTCLDVLVVALEDYKAKVGTMKVAEEATEVVVVVSPGVDKTMGRVTKVRAEVPPKLEQSTGKGKACEVAPSTQGPL